MSHTCHCHCCGATQAAPRRRRGLLRTVLSLAILYVTLVFGGGTLINTGHPVAAEAGRLIHTVTFVEPAAYWADSQGIDPLAHGLRVLQRGFPVHAYL